jgi:hypothetical protein
MPEEPFCVVSWTTRATRALRVVRVVAFHVSDPPKVGALSVLNELSS